MCSELQRRHLSLFVPYCTSLLVLVAFLPGAFAGAAAGKLFLGGSFLVERLWIPGLEFAVINLAWHGREKRLETGLGWAWTGLSGRRAPCESRLSLPC